jgi:D-proline reductase (dithiol) PrdB
VSTVEYMRTIREKYSKMGYAPYGWHEATEAPPWTPLAKPLSECRVGMMTTAGTYVAGQEAYFYKDDTSHRPIPSNTPVENLRFSHLTENYLPDARRDPNCAFPIEPLRQLVDEGVIGGLADNFFSCMGAVYSKRRVDEEVAPAIYEAFAKEGVDVAYLVPL